MAYRISPEDLSMLGVMKVLEEVDKVSLYNMGSLDKMASMISHTNVETKQTFGRLYATIQAGKANIVLYTPASPDEQEVWNSFVTREGPSSGKSAEACETAATLIINTWIPYPRPGTEQPYTPGPFNGSQNRVRVREAVFQNAQTLLQTLNYIDYIYQNRGWKFTIATLFDKLSWYYYELSNHTEASSFAERAIDMCENAMKDMMIFEEHAKWLLLLSSMQQARAVIASDLNDIQTALTFGEKQLAVASAAALSAPQVETTELARANMELGKIKILERNYAGAEDYFTTAVPVLKALPGYHKLQMYTILHGLGWIFLMQAAYEKAEDCFLEALADRNAAYGFDDIEGVQTGELLYSLGTVSALQGRMHESHDYFVRGKMQFELATGTTIHYNVAKISYKLAGVHIKELNWDLALPLLIQCDQYYGMFTHFIGMRARVQFRLSQVYACQGDLLQARDARILAWRLWKLMKPQDERSPTQLIAQDFEVLVVPWCR